MREYIVVASSALHLHNVISGKREFLIAAQRIASGDASSQRLAGAAFDLEQFAGAAVDLLLDRGSKADESRGNRQDVGCELDRFGSKRKKRQAVGRGCLPSQRAT